MTTRILLIRHGATALSAEDRFAGATDVELSAEGASQAGRLAERLKPLPVAAVYASPMQRTMDTARIVAGPLGLEVFPREALREISHGHWEGRTREEVERLFPEEYEQWESDPFTFAPPGGESGLAVTARALPAILDIVRAHDGGTVVVVSHKATIRLVISSLIGFDPRTYRERLDQSPAALNILDFRDPSHARLALFNDVSHYSDLPGVAAHRLSKIWE